MRNDAKYLFDWEIPFTKDTVVLMCDGTINLGFDLSKVSYRVDNAGKTIIVTLPEITVLSNELDTGSFETPLEEYTVFNIQNMGKYVDTLDELKTKAANETLADKYLVNEATEHAQSAIRGMLANVDVTRNYEVRFQ